LGFDKIKTLGTAIATSKKANSQKLNKMKIVIINYGLEIFKVLCLPSKDWDLKQF
jgi:hypothetical protein